MSRSQPLPSSALSVRHLNVRLGRDLILHDISLSFPRARWTCVVGPNGAGKSTLLKAMAGLVPSTGNVTLLSKPMSGWPRRQRAQTLAWLGQNEACGDEMTVWDVVMLGRLPHQAWLRSPNQDDRQAVSRALHATQAWAWRDHALGQLSGGERQRVLLARALALEAQVLLMDEPLSHLDPPHQADWLSIVQNLVREGRTVVSVLHEISMALHADELVVMNQGRVLHQGLCAQAATHRALEAVFDHRVQVQALQGQWVSVPRVHSEEKSCMSVENLLDETLSNETLPSEILSKQTSDTSFVVPVIEPLHQPELAKRLQHLLDNKTKPQGSLGYIERLAQRIGLILGHEAPELQAPQLVVFAGDHGLVTHGISAYPSDVTWQMVENFLSGGAAVSVLARQHGIHLRVVDCGVRHHFTERDNLLIRKIAFGTADALKEPAMSLVQCDTALSNGATLVKNLPGNALLLGEMGIGNTSAASMLMSRLTGLDITECTGAGAGLNTEAIQHKIDILRQVLARHAQATEPLAALAAFGGFEIATMVGAVLQAAQERRVIVVDGFIASAAVLVACALQPAVLERCVFAHRSGEHGHTKMLAYLRVETLLDLGLRLGEGSGAALAWPLLVSACAILREMASFEEAWVSRQHDAETLSPGS